MDESIDGVEEEVFSTKYPESSSHCSSRSFGSAKGLLLIALIECNGKLVASGRCHASKSALERKSNKSELGFIKSPDCAAKASTLHVPYRFSRTSLAQSSHAFSYRWRSTFRRFYKPLNKFEEIYGGTTHVVDDWAEML